MRLDLKLQDPKTHKRLKRTLFNLLCVFGSFFRTPAVNSVSDFFFLKLQGLLMGPSLARITVNDSRFCRVGMKRKCIHLKMYQHLI